MIVSLVERQWNPNLESKPDHQVYRLSRFTSCVDLLDAGLGWKEMPVFILLCITGKNDINMAPPAVEVD